MEYSTTNVSPYLTSDEFGEACHLLDNLYRKSDLGRLRRRWKLNVHNAFTFDGYQSYVSITLPVKLPDEQTGELADALERMSWDNEPAQYTQHADEIYIDCEAEMTDSENIHNSNGIGLAGITTPKLPTVTYDIIWQPIYATPRLWFTFNNLPVKYSATDHETVYHLLVPEEQKFIREMGVLGAISLEPHPITSMPAFFVHDCNTSETLTELAQQRGSRIPLEDYLVIWLGLVGHTVGLFVPTAMAMQLDPASRNTCLQPVTRDSNFDNIMQFSTLPIFPDGGISFPEDTLEFYHPVGENRMFEVNGWANSLIKTPRRISSPTERHVMPADILLKKAGRITTQCESSYAPLLPKSPNHIELNDISVNRTAKWVNAVPLHSKDIESYDLSFNEMHRLEPDFLCNEYATKNIEDGLALAMDISAADISDWFLYPQELARRTENATWENDLQMRTFADDIAPAVAGSTESLGHFGEKEEGDLVSNPLFERAEVGNEVHRLEKEFRDDRNLETTPEYELTFGDVLEVTGNNDAMDIGQFSPEMCTPPEKILTPNPYGKTQRVRYRPDQRDQLEAQFQYDNYLSDGTARKLASQMDVEERRITIWFKNRRTQQRKQANLDAIKFERSKNRLERLFRCSPYPQSEVKGRLALEIGVDPAYVNTWFAKRRQKAKKGRGVKVCSKRSAKCKAKLGPELNIFEDVGLTELNFAPNKGQYQSDFSRLSLASPGFDEFGNLNGFGTPLRSCSSFGLSTRTAFEAADNKAYQNQNLLWGHLFQESTYQEYQYQNPLQQNTVEAGQYQIPENENLAQHYVNNGQSAGSTAVEYLKGHSQGIADLSHGHPTTEYQHLHQQTEVNGTVSHHSSTMDGSALTEIMTQDEWFPRSFAFLGLSLRGGGNEDDENAVEDQKPDLDADPEFPGIPIRQNTVGTSSKHMIPGITREVPTGDSTLVNVEKVFTYAIFQAVVTGRFTTAYALQEIFYDCCEYEPTAKLSYSVFKKVNGKGPQRWLKERFIWYKREGELNGRAAALDPANRPGITSFPPFSTPSNSVHLEDQKKLTGPAFKESSECGSAKFSKQNLVVKATSMSAESSVAAKVIPWVMATTPHTSDLSRVVKGAPVSASKTTGDVPLYQNGFMLAQLLDSGHMCGVPIARDPLRFVTADSDRRFMARYGTEPGSSDSEGNDSLEVWRKTKVPTRYSTRVHW